MSPGKPIIIGTVESKPVIGLPGHPISALVCFDQFVVPIIRRLAGEDTCEPFLRPCVKAFLTRNVSSKEGRQDFVRVRLSVNGGEFYATPLPAKSGMVSAMSRTHGFVKIPMDCEGFYKDRSVNVYLFSNWLGGNFEKEYFSGNETTKGSPGNFNEASRQEQLSGFGKNSHS
jgi:molybdopterin molybdotransferase